MDAYGGAIARVEPDATAFVHRTPLYSIQYLAYWGAPVHQQPSLAWLRASTTRCARTSRAGAYVNYTDPRPDQLAERLLRRRTTRGSWT